jgi:amidophosphoribosyltransferase
VIGKLASGWVVESETAALHIVGASFVREVEPGELDTLDERAVRWRRFAPARTRRRKAERVGKVIVTPA